jgi:hypothetical protein
VGWIFTSRNWLAQRDQPSASTVAFRLDQSGGLNTPDTNWQAYVGNGSTETVWWTRASHPILTSVADLHHKAMSPTSSKLRQLACQVVSHVNLKTLHIHRDTTRHLRPQLISTQAVATLAERKRILNLRGYDPAVVH